ncbi:FG-GAP-like repeat-containing protein [Amycolatopsis sp. WGS_07]|uniref:FG-GAP-like repeat-containing protein n=1 Tax=Amycolatopsis sp. WGS_07 TaxID=3076764 RepID=UPI00387382DF
MKLHSRTAAVAAAVAAAGLLTALPASAVSGGTTAKLSFAAKLTADGRACSGSLVEPTLVLTAASCFPENPQGGTPAKPTTVTVGGHTAKVATVITRTDRDVALARLDTTITDAAPLKLPVAAGIPAGELSLAGWGRTSTEWLPADASVAKFTVSSSTATSVSLTGANGADACKGDAGGPVYSQDNVIVAVAGASWQHGCLGETQTRQGTTGARVDDLTGWIHEQAIVGSAKAVGHGVTVSWTPLAASDNATYSVYANASGPAKAVPEQLVGTTAETSLVHSAAARQNWSYLVVSSTGVASPSFSAKTGNRSLTDFTGDGKADIATFVRGSAGSVFVANSDGGQFVDRSVKWHDRFSIGDEIPLTGDFNGDGKADVATFTRGDTGDVYVALSDGTKFNGNGTLWQDDFGHFDDRLAIGDFNGDGKDDVVAFTTRGAVYVVLPEGTKFGPAQVWHTGFGFGNEVPMVGDFNGDGKDDIATFTRSDTADVFVALSDGSKFTGTSVKWHDNFAFNDEIPAVGDFNGDGKDDIAVFTRGPAGDVFVALSDGTKFTGTSVKWHDNFAFNDEIPAIGDFNGDGKDDIATFTRGDAGDVFVSLSDGGQFTGISVKWHDNFAFNNEVPAPRAITVL